MTGDQPQEPEDGPLALHAVELPRTAELLAEQLRRQILDGDLQPGQHLPTERELAVQSGHGRSTIREALGILKSDGLVASRPGRGGGIVVSEPTLGNVARSIEGFVRGRHLRYGAVLELRQILEPGAAALAARRHEGAQLDRIKDDHVAMDEAHRQSDVRAFSEANVSWHVDVGRATCNDVIESLMLGLSSTLLASIEHAEFNTADLRIETLRVHSRIVEAIEARDPEAAFRRMARHLLAHDDLQPKLELLRLHMDYPDDNEVV